MVIDNDLFQAKVVPKDLITEQQADEVFQWGGVLEGRSAVYARISFTEPVRVSDLINPARLR
jgi:hypothetical protein